MKYDNLNQEYTRLKQSVGLCSEELQLYHDLETAGFDLEKLKVLSNIVKDISKANNIPEDQARQKFYKDIKEQYNDKLALNCKEILQL